MTDLAKPTETEEIAKLLVHYSFDLGGYKAEQLIDHWMAEHPSHWARLSVIEALYQGRYKAVSIEQILMLWKRRGKPIPHFNGEFERIVGSRFPRDLTAKAAQTSEPEVAIELSSPWKRTSFPEAKLPRLPSFSRRQPTPEPIAPQSDCAAAEEPVAQSPEAAPEAALEDSSQVPLSESQLSETGMESKSLLPAAPASLSAESGSPAASELTLPVAIADDLPTLVTPEACTSESMLDVTNSDVISVEPGIEDQPSLETAARSPGATGSHSHADAAEDTVQLVKPDFLPSWSQQPVIELDAPASPIKTFQPDLDRASVANLKDWSLDSTGVQPIAQFVPVSRSSNFYTKLKAVVQSGSASESVPVHAATGDRAASPQASDGQNTQSMGQ